VLVTSAVALGVGVLGRPGAASAAPKGWKLPANAHQVDDDIYEIGTKEVNGETLVGYAILNYGHHAKPSGGGGGGGSPAPAYAYIASGFKWKTFGEPYVVDPTVANWGGTPNDTYVRSVFADAISQWEDAANGTLGDAVSVQVFGNETPGTVDRSKIGHTTNGVNEICFEDINQSGVIAVTFVWGTMGGPSGKREIKEFDQIYDDDGDWTWGDVVASGNDTYMDLANIATHELGHAFGMDHPSSKYPLETMYAYATEGETIKRDLHAGDIAGINLLY
jgi:hypothetical protein